MIFIAFVSFAVLASAEQVGKCGDGTQYCQEVCCYNGADLAFCCDFQHPVCDVPNNLCRSSFEAAMQAAMPKAVVQEIKAMPLMKVDDQVGKCGDGTQYCEEVCCYNGADLAFCCDYQHPVCDVPNNLCHSSFEAAMEAAKPKAVVEETKAMPLMKVDDQVGKCGDGTQYCEEVCCYNGADLAFCCDYQHPVCDVPNNLCRSSFEAAMEAAKPKAVVEEIKGMPLMKVDDQVGKCGDGTQYCLEVCCYNGVDLAFCCDYQYPVCDVPNNLCLSIFEVAMQAVKPKAAAEETKGMPLMKVDDQVGKCGDGTQYCQEVCCYNGADLAFCCDFQHPVCDVPNNLCRSSFEAAMQAAMPKAVVEEIKAMPLMKVDDQVGKCGDGTHYCEAVCCYNGADLAFCCDYQHPVCDVPNNLCRSSLEAAMEAAKPKAVAEEIKGMPLMKVDDQVGKCGDGTQYCEEVCCYNGADLAFCCDYQHPVCDVPNNLCRSSFEAAMQAVKPQVVIEETKAMPHMKVDDQVGKCGDGTQYCEEVCCYNGADLVFCCDFQHPVCDVPNNLCHSSFEAAMKGVKPGTLQIVV